MMLILILSLFLALIIFAIIRYSFLVPPVEGLPVLMYHKIDSSIPPDHLNVRCDQFEKQLQFLNSRKYSTISFGQLLDYVRTGIPLPPRPVMITFDDGYKNNFTQMYPLLKKYNCLGNIYLVSSFINRLPSPTDPNEYMTVDDLNNMDAEIIQYGLHTYDHLDYNKLDAQAIEHDLKKSKKQLNEYGIEFTPCFAYAYGSYPKKDIEKRKKLFDILESNGIGLAFRIGNRINKLPLQNKFLVERIDIRGTDSFFEFKTKLKKGRVKLFG